MGRGDTGVHLGTPSELAGGHFPTGTQFGPTERGYWQPVREHAFAHPAEQDLARILSFYRIRWVYEPATFHLEVREDGLPAEQITPDFYLPDHDLFIELTTMRQRLVTRKNRKIRRLREIFPTMRIKLLYRRDYDRLVGAYPAPDHMVDPRIGETVIAAELVQRRVAELAREIVDAGARLSVSTGVARHRIAAPLHMIGLGAGSRQALADMAAQMSRLACNVTTDQLVVSRYDGAGDGERVRIGEPLGAPVAGRDVILLADIVSSGLSLVYVTNWLRAMGARSVRVCALLDRSDARIIDVPLDFVGFQAPDRVLAGYGLSSYPQFRDLPFIAALQDSGD